jgi:hypothetical protein
MEHKPHTFAVQIEGVFALWHICIIHKHRLGLSGFIQLGMPAGTRDIVAVMLKGEVTPQATVNVSLVTTSQCLNLGS